MKKRKRNDIIIRYYNKILGRFISMEMKDIIEKVNYYSRLSKKRALTAEEEADRAIWRKRYLEKLTSQVRKHLDSIQIVDEKEQNKIQ